MSTAKKSSTPKTEAKKPTKKPEPEEVVTVTTSEDTSTVAPAVTVGPTGLCLQCKKPADHKHAGI